jgi:hypothetical protein
VTWKSFPPDSGGPASAGLCAQPRQPIRTYAFIFICQSGELEIKSAILAASLKRWLRVEHELIAAIPQPESRWGTVSNQTLEFLRSLGVRAVPIENQVDLTYPIANKIGCLSLPTTADKLVFLDSDMVLMRPFGDDARFAIPFNCRPASNPSFAANDSDWSAVYEACGAKPLPGIVRTTYSGLYIHPYFNAAFIAVPGNSRFGDVWLDCCCRIDAVESIPNKRPYLDQIALSPAVSRFGWAYDCLDERYNHPINFKPIDATDPPIVCHYHDLQTLQREPTALAQVRSLADEFSDLRAIIQMDDDWSNAIRSAAPNPPATPELIITGIPRSGTSYLCNLLHRCDNCVMLNEPDDLGPALDQRVPWPVATFYRDIRRDVVAGKSIRNKLVDGKVTEDTARGGNVQVTYSPKVASRDFVLGVKTTIPFLSRLPMLRRVMPNARVVVVVRNPFDAIASWKSTFEHLREGDPRRTRIGNPNDPWLSGVQRSELEQVAAIGDVVVRRAAWWRYLAQLVLENARPEEIVRYEDLVTDPLTALATVQAGWPFGNVTEPIEPSAVRRNAQALDDADVQAIRSACSDLAIRLGVYRAEP